LIQGTFQPFTQSKSADLSDPRFQVNSLYLYSSGRRGEPDTVSIRKGCVKIRYPAVDKCDLDVLTGNSSSLHQILKRMTFSQIVRSARVKITGFLIYRF
jgi:hypothetical protein